MRTKSFIQASSIASAIVLVWLVFLKFHINYFLDRWGNQGIELNLAQKIFMGFALFWSRFWLFAWPFVIGAVFSITAIVFFLLDVIARRRASKPL